MPDRRIKRLAFLQRYDNRPWELKEVLPEVAVKGYAAVAFAVEIDQEQFFAELAEEAKRLNLEVMAFTGYMKYQEVYLKDHPDQRMVLSSDRQAADQDSVTVNWGCPFNPVFKKRYLDFLQRLARTPNLSEVWINDEALWGFQVDQLACYCPVCQQAWRNRFGGEIPRHPFENQQQKVQFVRWRFERWNQVHAEMKDACNIHHPVRTVFLTSPACCFGLNPWVTGVDPASLAETVDGIMTDPYYTFHHELAKNFRPREVYLSECCRFVSSICGEGKQGEICAQGFSHATFTRPMDRRDGWWAGVIPAALGVDVITAYTYLLQRSSPMQETYENSFKLDEYFNRTTPVSFIGIVNSLETQCFHIDANSGPDSWLVSRMLPVSEVIRQHGLPYGYLPSSRLTGEYLLRFAVIILPSVSCLSADARSALRAYVESGGMLIACGQTATHDEVGQSMDDPFLEDVFGVKSLSPLDRSGQFTSAADHPALAGLPWPDETTVGHFGGGYRPVLGLDHIVRIEVSAGSEILASFADGNLPAITVRPLGRGRTVFLAGIPARTFHQPQLRHAVLNFSGTVLGQMILHYAGDKLPVTAKDFGVHVPMRKLRPLDPRSMHTAEFMLSEGEDLLLATIASYFREPMQFQLEAKIPAGKKCVKIRELINDRPVEDFRRADKTIVIDVNFSFDDCIHVFAFFLEQEHT